jgi:hypothetical protein
MMFIVGMAAPGRRRTSRSGVRSRHRGVKDAGAAMRDAFINRHAALR